MTATVVCGCDRDYLAVPLGHECAAPRGNAKAVPAFGAIVDAACAATGVTVQAVLGSSRLHSVTGTRAAIVLVARAETELSWAAIGERLGARGESGACRIGTNAVARDAADPAFASLIVQITKAVSA
ncbi:MAG TPA: hypothetical protein VEW67_04135 [Thermoleophilaceae bacterium]|nr:hypothetical protein [Thermoleophilaceae bacterium]